MAKVRKLSRKITMVSNKPHFNGPRHGSNGEVEVKEGMMNHIVVPRKYRRSNANAVPD